MTTALSPDSRTLIQTICSDWTARVQELAQKSWIGIGAALPARTRHGITYMPQRAPGAKGNGATARIAPGRGKHFFTVAAYIR